MEYPMAGVAAMIATALTNPMEVIRTRQQVQGELLPPGLQFDKKSYSGITRTFRTIVKSDGFKGLQKGLTASLIHSFLTNSSRFGLFEWADKMGWTRDSKTGFLHPGRSALISCITGIVGLTLGCPLLMVKTQMQIDSSHVLAVGFQHKHTSVRSALVQEFRNNGVRSLWRGYMGVLPRGIVSSVVQMTTFSFFKEHFSGKPYMDTHLKAVFTSCTLSGCVLVLVLTPFDVINTRVLNQAVDTNGKGLLYRGVIDCLVKTVRVEGAQALYKGLVANTLLVCPHFIIHMIIWESFKKYFEEHHHL